MKSSIPETGRVITLEGNMAIVMLQGGESCRGCGAGRIGLCGGAGHMSLLTAKNTAGAAIGDVVTVGISQETQVKGFLFAFIIPFVSLLAGSAIGYVIGRGHSLEVITGFASLLVSSWFFLKKLRNLDRSQTMVVKEIVSEYRFTPEWKTEEEQRFEGFEAKGC